MQEVFQDTWGAKMPVFLVGVNQEEMGDVFVEWGLVLQTPRALPQKYFVSYNWQWQHYGLHFSVLWH